MSPTLPQGFRIELRAADHQDVEKTLTWQHEPGARHYFRQPNPPSASEHDVWFQKRLAQSDPDLWIIEFRDQSVGSVRLDQQGDHDCPRYEVSILIATGYRGQGIGVQALDTLRKTYPERHLVATISPDNQASIAAFVRAGFRQTGPDTYEASASSGVQTQQRSEPPGRNHG